MPFINVRGVDHFYQWIRDSNNTARKPVMVFVHGWAGSARYWSSTAHALSADFDCLLYDMRGFGRSTLPDQPLNLGYEMSDYADDLAILLDQLGLTEISVQAHSMGASVATFFINRHRDRVKQAILTCNGIFEYDERAFKAFHKFGAYVVKFRYQWFLKFPFADRMFMARFLSRPIDKSDRFAFLEDFLLADYESALGTIFTSVSKEAVEIMPREFANIEVPTLLVSGEKDQIIPAKMAKQASKLNHKLDYLELSNTGHFPMLEDSDSYLRGIRNFLQQSAILVESHNR
ncbi:putative hydrolase or acyltransferase of alpha/beta superfamily [Xenococcus sp. PCC 7305]|uniref:alpha/beta fold hydrolase n=1 Tax=Xenococcus sp. PCC 7305 TaxID=102125 RepID=UPI0002AC4DDF|nr:alpha/beta hydrolase [Xenococcus sp. PCC 7305]ELS03415.1 putative hydrolase or acyltransferase of alpha/beta superfamily [Xenococcus sp. PCC 7305]